MSQTTGTRIGGGAELLGGGLLTAMGMPQVGVPLMVGGASGGLTGSMAPEIGGAVGGGLGSMGAFGGPNMLENLFGQGASTGAATTGATIPGAAGDITEAIPGAATRSAGATGMGGMGQALQGAALMKGLMPQQQTPQMMQSPPPIQRPMQQAMSSTAAPLSMPAGVPLPQMPRYLG